MNQFIFVLVNALGFSIPALLFWIEGIPLLAVLAIISALLWLFARKYSWYWYNTVAIMVGVLLNAVGVCLNFPPLLHIFSTNLIVIAWDMSHYREFLKQAGPGDQVKQIARLHYLNILLFLIISVTFSIFSISIHLQLNFIIAVLFVVISIAGLMRLVLWLHYSTLNN